MMSPPSPTKFVRKELYDIFQQLTVDDIRAANFFIRSDTSRKCKDVFDLMEVLEKLAYFHVSKKRVKLNRLIELFKNIDRVDLQKRLKTYADELQLSGNYKNDDSSSSVSMNDEEGYNNSPKYLDSSKKETKFKGYKKYVSSVSVSTSDDEEKSNSSERSDSSEEETSLKDYYSDMSSANISMNDNEEKSYSSKHSDSSKDERDLKGKDIEDPRASVTSSSTENATEVNIPPTDTEVESLEIDMGRMSLKTDCMSGTPINEPHHSIINEESSSDEDSIGSEASSSGTITLYNYQRELGEKGKTGANCLICSPTGSGKTITAASIIKHNLEEAKRRDQFYRVLYLVHIRYLVKHLAIDLKKILGDEVYSLEDDDLLTSEIVQRKAVVILTAQILDNALNSKHVELSDYDLLVFDECHNTVGKHPYNEIMKKYHKLKRSRRRAPQVLGLSATLAGGHDPFKAIVQLCANMHCPSVSCVRREENVRELSEKNKAPMIDDIIPCKSRPKSDKFFNEISKNMRKYIIDLETIHKIEFGNPIQEGSEEMESFLTQQKKKCEREKSREIGKIFEFLITMNKALIYYNELTASDVLDYLREANFESDNYDLGIEREIASVYRMIMSNIRDHSLDDSIENNDKLKKLKDLLISILRPNPLKKVILLCRTRFNTTHLKDLIMEDSELKKFVKADFLIGRNDNGMTQKQQADKLKSFQNGELNLLIATSIAEQGLNIPDCEYVIRYLYVTSDISRKQALGRARKENSKCYLIAEEDNDHINRDYRNKLREKEMDAAMEKVTEMGEQNFKEEVAKRIKFLNAEADYNSELENNYHYPFRAEDVNIYCKDCHNLLCYGSDILKKGTDYICISPDFESKVEILPCKEQHFRLDVNIGIFKCKDRTCKNRFGAVKCYKFGERRKGYALNAKSILFEVKGSDDKFQLKKWSKHPFPINSESLN